MRIEYLTETICHKCTSLGVTSGSSKCISNVPLQLTVYSLVAFLYFFYSKQLLYSNVNIVEILDPQYIHV